MLACGEFLVEGSTSVPSPWFRRLGDSATFFCEVIAIRDAVMAILVRTKNSDDPDSGATTLTTLEISGTGVDSVHASGMDELVRFEYTVTAATDDPPTARFVHFRMLPPAWEGNEASGENSYWNKNDTKEAS